MRFRVPAYDLGHSTLCQRFGPYDPSCRWNSRVLVKALWTPQGPCTLALRQQGEDIEVELVGQGKGWVREHLPEMFAFAPQELPTSAPSHLQALAQRLKGVRVGPILWKFDLVVAYVLQQRVTFREAAASYARILQQKGQDAPGPLPLKLPLRPEEWLAYGLDRLQSQSIDAKRARTLLRVAERGPQPSLDILARLPGIGPWTLESVRGWGWGDPDALPPGDVHLPHELCYFLAGERPGSDSRMMQLMEPYRGMRLRLAHWVVTRPRGAS